MRRDGVYALALSYRHRTFMPSTSPTNACCAASCCMRGAPLNCSSWYLMEAGSCFM